jgi:hypothetical protein
MRATVLLTVAAAVALATPMYAAEPLDEHLEPLRPFLGKTWRGTFADATPEHPVVDISHWERALGGAAVRMVHSINDGQYGGETIVFWDRERQSLAYYYFTTAGFYTHGTMKVEGTRWTSHETVTGSQQGITEVAAVSEVLPDGRLHVTSRYFKNGAWVAGHEVTYVEDPSAEVVFK